jgi:transposase
MSRGKLLTDERILLAVKLLKEGKTIKEITEATEIRCVSTLFMKLKKNGAILPNTANARRDWSKIVEIINKQ